MGLTGPSSLENVHWTFSQAFGPPKGEGYTAPNAYCLMPNAYSLLPTPYSLLPDPHFSFFISSSVSAMMAALPLLTSSTTQDSMWLWSTM